MTDPKRLSDAACSVQMTECSVCDFDYTCPGCRFATEVLARGRELEGLREKCSDFEAAWRTANAEANDHYARIRTLEAENAALRGLAALDIGDGKG